MIDFCLNFMKMVNKMRLVQQIIEKLTLEVGAKIAKIVILPKWRNELVRLPTAE